MCQQNRNQIEIESAAKTTTAATVTAANSTIVQTAKQLNSNQPQQQSITSKPELPLTAKPTLPPKMDLNKNMLKKVQNETKGLIRRTSSSIDEKRKECQTPTLTSKINSNMNNPEIKLFLNAPAVLPAKNQPISQNKNNFNTAVAPKTAAVVSAHVVPSAVNSIRPQLVFNSKQTNTTQITESLQQKQQILEQSRETVCSEPVNKNIEMNQKTSPMKPSLLVRSNNLMNANKSNTVDIVQTNQPIQASQPVQENQSVQASLTVSTHQQSSTDCNSPFENSTSLQITQVNPSICKSDLSGKRSISTLQDNCDSELAKTLEKKIKTSSEDRIDYSDCQYLKKDIIKEMEEEEDEECDNHDDSSSSSVWSHTTVKIDQMNSSSFNKKKIMNTSGQEQQQQQQEEIMRKRSDMSDDSQKSLSYSPFADSQIQQQNIQLTLQKQRKRSEQLELSNKINQNLSFIESKKEKILKISELIEKQLTPEMMRILKEQVQRQKEILYQSQSTSSKKQNKINRKYLDQILNNNVQFLQNLKI